MQAQSNVNPGLTERTDKNRDRREKEFIMERIYQSQVYREFTKQWGEILSGISIEVK